MPENREAKLNKLAEEFHICKGLSSDEHIKILGQIHDFSKEQAIDILCYFLTLETNPEVLLYMVNALHKYNVPAAFDIFTELILWKDRNKSNHKDLESYVKLRCAIAKILGSSRDNKAVLPLLYVLNNKDENYKLRLSCAEALGQIGNNYAVAPRIDVVSDENEKSVYLRESSAKALGMIGDIRAIDPLVSILETKKGIIESLGRIGIQDDRTIKVLKNALYDEAPYIRLGAIEALSDLDDNRVIPLVEKMLYDKEEDVARGAVSALYNICGREYLIELLKRNELAEWCKDEAQTILDEEEEDID